MELINYVLLSLITYLGLFCGVLLIRIAPEEQRPGKKYFLILQKIIFTVIGILLVINFSVINLALAAAVILFLVQKNIHYHTAYIFFTALIFLTVLQKNGFLILSFTALVFLFGMASASLITVPKNWKSSIRIMLELIYFPLAAIALFATTYLF